MSVQTPEDFRQENINANIAHWRVELLKIKNFERDRAVNDINRSEEEFV